MVNKTKEKVEKKTKASLTKIDKSVSIDHPTMFIATEREIAMDFATKVYKEFEQTIKAAVYFGSSAKKESTPQSDIDIIIVIDDATIKWDDELIATYREELGKVIQSNPYRKPLHVNTVKLSTWWEDLNRGDPVVINILRYGEALIDYGGFFNPLKALLADGKIRATPEAIYSLVQRAPLHLGRARLSLLGAVDAYYWACVDSAHAALIASEILPPSPEQIPEIMNEAFVKTKMIKSYYVDIYSEVHTLSKDIVHGKIAEISGKKLDELKTKAEDFVLEMTKLVKDLIEKK